ncbi:hypothetical protein PWR63_23745 [Paraburkholderia sp. A2WS-5]|uniref:hypothetical protein n=1 Tax=Paraburkholderia sp. A2WS-5 TaxID=3028372 RepID=UPI003B7E3201
MISMPEDEFRTYVVQRFEAQDAAIAENTALTRKTDETVTRVAEDTSFMREAWKDGIATVRFFCRLAQAWRFLLRQVAIPVVIPLFAAYAGLYYAAHGHFPPWLADTVKLILAIV